MDPRHSGLSQVIRRQQVTPFIGVYDVFSATLAAQRFDNLFLSGFGFAASHYGLPDVGFIAWTDMLAHAQRIRNVLPDVRLLVDIDDGYGDADIAGQVTRAFDQLGVFGVVLEDQQRPRRCGHMGGKLILPLDEYLRKLESVLQNRSRLFVIARTDASEPEEIFRRARSFEEVGADAVLADGISDLSVLEELRRAVNCPIAFNQLAGGKSPACDWKQLETLGVSVAIYSTPCLFAAQRAMEVALEQLKESGGSLEVAETHDAVLDDCNEVLYANLLPRPESPMIENGDTRLNGTSTRTSFAART